MPFPAHGDTLPVVKGGPKYEGSGEARQLVGTVIEGLLLFDSCAHVRINIPDLDPSSLPSTEFFTERNMKMNFVLARFKNLVITFSGGDYGAIRYKGTASGVEFLNLNPPAPAK